MAESSDGGSAAEQQVTNLLANMNDGMERVGHLFQVYAPDVVDLVLEVVRMGAVLNLVWGVINIVAAYVLLRVGFAIKRRFDADDPDNVLAGEIDTRQFLYFVATAASFVFAFGVTLSGLSAVLDAGNLLGAFDPKLGLAYRAVSSVGLF